MYTLHTTHTDRLKSMWAYYLWRLHTRAKVFSYDDLIIVFLCEFLGRAKQNSFEHTIDFHDREMWGLDIWAARSRSSHGITISYIAIWSIQEIHHVHSVFSMDIFINFEFMWMVIFCQFFSFLISKPTHFGTSYDTIYFIHFKMPGECERYYAETVDYLWSLIGNSECFYYLSHMRINTNTTTLSSCS